MAQQIRTIVVGVASLDDQDPHPGEGDSDPVLAPAVRLARELGATLHVVHAFELPGELAPRWTDSGAGATSSLDSTLYAARMEEHLKAQLARIPGGSAVQCRVVEGSAGERLCEAVRELEADLLVVGATRRGAAWSGILGSTAERVLIEASVPVLVIHRPFQGPVRRALLTTDLSPLSAGLLRRALEVVDALFGHSASELRCVYTLSYDPMLPPPLPEATLESVAGRDLRGTLTAAAPAERAIEPRVRVGDPAREIVYEAAEWSASLLVLGTHADPDHPHRPLGAIATAVIRGAPCNVLAIPTSLVATTGHAERPASEGMHTVATA